MSCVGFDVRDYFLGELPEAEKVRAGRHIQGCGECGAELEQLQFLQGALRTVRDEEPPQRIGFVSDKVFEPSPVRRFLGSFWISGARLGFASAAMLSAAMVVSALHQPAVKVVERQVAVAAAPQPDVQGIVNQAVAKAVADTEARLDKKTRALLAVSEDKHEMAENALKLQLASYVEMAEKRQGYMRASTMEIGGDRP